MQAGFIVFSPISHTHSISEACELPLGWDYWSTFDRAYLSMSCSLYVLCLDGWQESVGVNAEIEIAKQMDIEIQYLEQSNPRTDDHQT